MGSNLQNTQSVTLVRRPVPADVPQFQNCSPLLSRIVASRGVNDDRALSSELKYLYPINSLKGVDEATQRLCQALALQQRVLIVGDFDADGATATALCKRALASFGFEFVDYIVPNRFEYGYGLTPEIIDVAAPFQPELIITVDNGISSIEGVSYARKLGIDVIITDHHLPGKQLPEAIAIVNPNQPDDTFESKNLAGVGVIFYLMLALKQSLTALNHFKEKQLPPPNIVRWLDLVALGTVADVVPLDSNNRILVEQGLRRIRAGQCTAGVLALMRVAKKDHKQSCSQDLGFACGPRLNAAGRLDDMSLGIECLLTDSLDVAMSIASELDELNRARRELESGMKHDALKLLDFIDLDKKQLPPIICLYHEEWHQGIVGIIAARIRERYYRPCIIFAPGTDGEIKGSGRSIPGIHMRDVIDRVATLNSGLVEKFGGHAMAAGLSLKTSDFMAFEKAVTMVVSEQASSSVFKEELLSDGELEPEFFSLVAAEELSQRVPWGQGFPAPAFDDVFEIVERRVLKDIHIKYMLRKKGQSGLLQAIVFNVEVEQWPTMGDHAHFLYQLSVNEYNGQRSLQIMIQRQL